MKRRSRAGTVKPRRRKSSTLKRSNASNPARNRGASIAGQETVVARLTRERDEALLREAANSEILRLISKSPGDLELVFRSILKNATRICNANFGTLFRFDGENLYPAAQFNTPAALLKAQTRRGPFKPTPGTSLHQVVRTKQVFHSADMAADPVPSMAAKLAGARSLVAVPMLKDDALIGEIIIYRQEVRPFTDKQIELVQSFAAEAVIGIENTRLLNELRQRTTDLGEALEQQTASAQVLHIISTSPGKLQPVFEAILVNAVRFCKANYGALWLREEDGFRNVAFHGLAGGGLPGPRGMAFPASADLPLHRIARSRKPVHVADLRTDQAYIDGHPLIVSVVDGAGIRTYLGAPMLKADELVGVISIFRKEVRPFTERSNSSKILQRRQ